MTFNTGNPIGSTDARDLSDNSEFLDLVANSLNETELDRFGRTRDTLEGIYKNSAYYRVGTFDAGYTLTNNRQTLAYGNVEYSWSGAFPKVVTAGSTPATSGGIGAGAWVDRTDETLRNELSSNSGAGKIGTAYNLSVDYLISAVMSTGNVVRASAYSNLVTDTEIFTAMLNAAKDANGYHTKTLVNDLQRPLAISQRFEIRSHNISNSLTDSAIGHVGLYGEFILSNGGGFDFYKCRGARGAVHIYDGGGNVVSDIAVRFEGGCLSPAFDIVGTQYTGILFGTTGTYNAVTEQGVSQCLRGTIVAYGGGGAFSISNTTGFGTLTSVWEGLVTNGSVISSSYDVNIGAFENIVASRASTAQLAITSSVCKFGMLATGAWGDAQVKIVDSDVIIGQHLANVGLYPDVNTVETLAMSAHGNSNIDISISYMVKGGQCYKCGNGAIITISKITAYYVNRIGFIINDSEYSGTSSSTEGSIIIKEGYAYRTNPSTAISTKQLFTVNSNITGGTLKPNIKVVQHNYGRVNNYTRVVEVQTSNKNFRVDLTGFWVIALVGEVNSIKLYHQYQLVAMTGARFDNEIDYNTVTSTGNGRRVVSPYSVVTTSGVSTVYSEIKSARVTNTITITTGGYFNVLINGEYATNINQVGVGCITFDLLPGDTYQYNYSNATITGTKIKNITTN